MGAAAVQSEMAKGAFAAHIGVSPARISQYITEGKLRSDALVGEGRSAKINVAVALKQLRGSLDISQRLGNGIATNLDGPEPDEASTEANAVRQSPVEPPAVDLVVDELKQLKLRAARRADQADAEAELARRGTYVRADATKAEMIRLAVAIIEVFEGGISDMASALSAELKVPARDVTHILRREFRNVRAKAADAARRRSTHLPSLVADDVGAGEDDKGAA